MHDDAKRGGVLRTCLRQGGKRRRKRTFGPEKRGRLQGKPMIDTRPEAVETRDEAGHWEGDTVMGSITERDCLLTLVERSTGLVLVAKLPHRTATAVNRAALKLIRESGLPFKTITWDNGTEFHGYKELEQGADIRCYFASAPPVAARQQRELQLIATAVLSQTKKPCQSTARPL